jgi:hypothetical protein
MSDTKFTQEPWQYGRIDTIFVEGHFILTATEELPFDEKWIAKVFPVDEESQFGAESIANARLLAKAPQMYAVLKALLVLIEATIPDASARGTDLYAVVKSAEWTLRQARGEAQS